MCPNSLIQDSYQDFILSRQAALLAPKTIEFYEYTIGGFLESLEITDPQELTSKHVREFLLQVKSRGVSTHTVHAFARGTRAFLRFLNEEGYIPNTYKSKNA